MEIEKSKISYKSYFRVANNTGIPLDIFHKVGVTYWKILSQIFTEYASTRNSS